MLNIAEYSTYNLYEIACKELLDNSIQSTVCSKYNNEKCLKYQYFDI